MPEYVSAKMNFQTTMLFLLFSIIGKSQNRLLAERTFFSCAKLFLGNLF